MSLMAQQHHPSRVPTPPAVQCKSALPGHTEDAVRSCGYILESIPSMAALCRSVATLQSGVQSTVP
jgi:hypothetical protein